MPQVKQKAIRDFLEEEKEVFQVLAKVHSKFYDSEGLALYEDSESREEQYLDRLVMRLREEEEQALALVYQQKKAEEQERFLEFQKKLEAKNKAVKSPQKLEGSLLDILQDD